MPEVAPLIAVRRCPSWRVGVRCGGRVWWGCPDGLDGHQLLQLRSHSTQVWAISIRGEWALNSSSKPTIFVSV